MKKATEFVKGVMDTAVKVMDVSSRKYDIVILGATGYTGKLTVAQMFRRSGKDIKWAVAGRSTDKVTKVVDELVKELKVEDGFRPDVLHGDTSDVTSMDALCHQCRVLVSLVGPYQIHGLPVVQACLRAGTHFLDITGEANFQREMISRYDDSAKAKGVALVTACGFDSVPSDIGNYIMHTVAAENGDTLHEVRGVMKVAGFSPSGGTMASMDLFIKNAKREDFDGLSLNPIDARTGIKTPMTVGVGYSSALSRWTIPFIMAAANEKVVRRSNAILGRPTAIYSECMSAKSFLGAVVGCVSYYVGLSVMLMPVIGGLVRKHLFPAQGDGPSAESNKKGFYEMTLVGTPSQHSGVYIGRFGDKAEGYNTTARILTECAILMAKKAVGVTVTSSMDEAPSQFVGGVHTPATAFGGDLVKGLRSIGFVVEASRKN